MEQYSPIVRLNLSDAGTPKLIEVATEDFVTNGAKNSYFRFLIDSFVNSTTNGAVIDEIARNIYGKGLALQEEMQDDDGYSEMDYIEDSPELEKINKMIKAKDLKAIVKDRVILGNAAVKIIYKGSGTRKKIHEIKHFPVQTLAPKKISVDKVRRDATSKGKDSYEFKGEVEAFYYHPRWEDYKTGDELTKIPAYGYGKSVEIYIIKDYVPNFFYWSPVEYSGALDYCVIEKEIGAFLVNDIKNGFSPTTLINIQRDFDSFDKREQLVSDMKSRMTGSSGDKMLIQFNASKEEATTFDQFPLSDAPAHYEYLATEASRKILTAHRVPDPKLLGVPGESGGLSNNAKEVEIAFEKFSNTVIMPYQLGILDALKELLLLNGIEADLVFIPVTPLDFDKHSESEEGFGDDTIDDGEGEEGGAPEGEAPDAEGGTEDA